MDVDYQEEAMSYGYTENGKFRHSYAGLPRLPVDGYYHYRTNPDPKTVPWVITGAMKVNRILSRSEVDAILAENGVEPTKWQGPDGQQMDAEDVQYSPRVNSNKLARFNAESSRHVVSLSFEAPILANAFEVNDKEHIDEFREIINRLQTRVLNKEEGIFFETATQRGDVVKIAILRRYSDDHYGIVDVYKLDATEYEGHLFSLIDLFTRGEKNYNEQEFNRWLESFGESYGQAYLSRYNRRTDRFVKVRSEASGKGRTTAGTSGSQRNGGGTAGGSQGVNDSFSLRETSTEELTDEYLANLNPADMDTEADRLFLQRYQTRRQA